MLLSLSAASFAEEASKESPAISEKDMTFYLND
jgi:hypothetical protein